MMISRARRIAGGDRLRATAAPFADLLGATLPGAACTGRAPLHDLDIDGETTSDRTDRHAYALAVCHHCPVLARCALAEAALPRDVVGVWAGRVRGGRGGRTV